MLPRRSLAKLKRIDQVEMPDLEFLRDLAKDWSIKLKIFNRQLIMYSEEEYEAKPPVYTILYGASNIISYQFKSVLNDMFAKGEVAYMSPETRRKHTRANSKRRNRRKEPDAIQEDE